MKARPFILFTALFLSIPAGSACPPDGEPLEPVAQPVQPPPHDNATENEQTESNSNDAALPHFLVLGGGYSPGGNQVSLEKNVLYFRRVLGELGLLQSPRHLLFADGRDRGRDLQFMDPAFEVPELNRALAELVGSTKGIANQYRSNGLAPNGSSSLDELDKWFDATGSRLGQDDRLLIYFTGHGGKGDKKTPHNTNLYLWNNQKIKMEDFTKRLDKLPVETPVVMVMVQCYSGGFANVIFKGGNPKNGMADHPRAGFFATVHDRVAAGCTPDIREENYKEYSTNFWEALCGKTRLGETMEKPDFNGDGRTSYAEAHAHVILTSPTIDIPVKTSDAFLRHYSRTHQPKDKNASKSTAPGEWLRPEDDYTKILERANPIERAVLEGLSAKLSLHEQNRAQAARDQIKELEEQRKKLADKKKKSEGDRNRIKGKLASAIRKRWPEVGNPYHPRARELFEPENSKQVMDLLKREGEWDKYLNAKQVIARLEKKRFELDRRKVKCMRFLRTLENVTLEANLPLTANDDILARHDTLRSLENETLEAGKPGT